MRDTAEFDLALRLLKQNQGLSAHAMGIGGVGLSGVALLLRERGWSLSGCDAAAPGAMAERLRRSGVAVASGHDPAHIDDSCDLLIRSAAVPVNHPEVMRARGLGIPVARRGAVLAALVSEATSSVVVCGTHGKTTTTCFTVGLLQALGDEPAWCVGGATASMGSVAQGGGGPLVVEGDESDGTLADYAARVLVLTNVDADHLEHFGSQEALRDCFAAVLAGTRGGIVYCADDPAASALCASYPDALGYGFGPASRLRITGLRLEPERMTFGVSYDGASLGDVTMSVTGHHNALNAVAALGAAVALGHSPAAVLPLLERLNELPGRRFERLLLQDGIEVVTDYSHHPAEIAALTGLARLRGARRLIAVFQPHRYSRTLALGRDFPPAFAGIDELLLLPVYAASEAPLPGGTIADLYRIFREQSPADVPVPRLAGTRAATVAWLRRELRAGDLLLVVGAGDVDQVGHEVAAELRARRRSEIEVAAERLAKVAGVVLRPDAPLAGLTTLGVGGCADLLAEVDTDEALAAVLRYCHGAGVPCRVMGGGSNTLVGDLGVRGVVVRLTGAAFRAIEFGDDGGVVVGCGVPGGLVLRRLTEAGRRGLEFMEGIPGVVGGWTAMNAGAHGGSFGMRVRAIRGLKNDGTTVIVSHDEAGFGYRHCRALESVTAVRVELALDRDGPAEIAARRAEFRRRRLDLRGFRSAGSVFRNPVQAPAGRLLDESGCKGWHVGGARVFERHANVIVTESGAMASDVLALMEMMRSRVLMEHGTELTTEIQVWADFEK